MKKPLYLYNTAARKKEKFYPLHPQKVTLYTCGPTVYNYAHLGNLRTFIFEDILLRTLEYNYFRVQRVMNITDVGHLTSDADTGEDKMEKGSQREGKTVWEISKFYTEAFIRDLQSLNCKLPPPQYLPKATDYIQTMIDLIKTLEKKGYTYTCSDGIYFDTTKFPHYKNFARLDVNGLQEGARIEKNLEKKHHTDFALWKFSPTDKKRQMEWNSPWGMGFPGWHIECSAMAMALLGKTIDLHCGGVDHIPVHHTNEIAQAEAATGKIFARYWLHGDWLVLGTSADKMAKSGDNFITLQTLNNRHINLLAFRYLCLSTHYRSKLNFSWKALEAAAQGYKNLEYEIMALSSQVSTREKNSIVRGKNSSINKKFQDMFQKEVNDDLNTPAGLVLVGKILSDVKLSAQEKYATLLNFDTILGLNLSTMHFNTTTTMGPKNISSRKNNILSEVTLNKKLINLLTQRSTLREQKKWSEADTLRKKIEQEYGLILEDTSDTVIVKKK